MRIASLWFSLVLLLVFFGAPLAADERGDEKKPLPEGPPIDGFKQLLPRGAIAAVVDPVFVSAQDAEIPDEAWILGFVHDGQAFAYDLNLLNHHEVVNHGPEGAEFAAVW